jgi:lipid biosynthesis B12-binding/radical SAM protein
MARILLVSSNVTEEPMPVYPLGLAMVAAALAAEGHQVEQFDFLVAGLSLERLRARIRAFEPGYVGISIRNLDDCDSLTRTSYPALAEQLTEVVRETPGIRVILGGAGFSIMPEALLALTGADHGVVGEGERGMCGLIRQLEAGRRPPPLVREAGLLAGADLLAPRYSAELVAFYRERSGMINLQTKRGCTEHCIYCNYPQLEGCRLRPAEPRAVVDTMERAQREHQADAFFITDAIFNDKEGHYLAVVDELLRRDLGLSWYCYMRPQGLDRGTVALMVRAGLRAVELGTDAASDTTLAALGKGLTFAEVLAATAACAAEQLPCAHFVMFGGPGETPATVTEGLANLERLDRSVVFAFSGIRILPGTPLQALAIRDGIISRETPLLEPAYYFAPGLDAEAMNQNISHAFRHRRDRVFPPEEGRRRHQTLSRMGHKGLLWDTLLRPTPMNRTLHAQP